MNFLTKYHATVDCKAEVVSLKNGDSIIEFQEKCGINEKKWVLVLKVDKMLRNGAYGYLTHIQEKIEVPIKLRDVLIVK